MKPKIIHKTIILVELVLIVIVAFYLFYNYRLPHITAVPLRTASLQSEPTQDLKYFYEMTSDTYEEKTYIPPWLPYTPAIHINSDTLNDRFEYSKTKPEKTFRILTLGDSWTYGRFVSTANNFSEKLEDTLNTSNTCPNIQKFEVINLGEPGYDISYEVERYKKRGAAYNPDLILWFVIPNDFTEIADFIRGDTEQILAKMDSTSKPRQGDSIPLDATVKPDQYTPHIKAVLQAMEDLHKTYTDTELAAFQLSAMKKIRSSYTGPIILFSLNGNADIGSLGRGVISNFTMQDTNASYAPIPLELSKTQLLPDGHPNNAGHKAIANELIKVLSIDRALRAQCGK